jgi:hypothetical protein
MMQHYYLCCPSSPSDDDDDISMDEPHQQAPNIRYATSVQDNDLESENYEEEYHIVL